MIQRAGATFALLALLGLMGASTATAETSMYWKIQAVPATLTAETSNLVVETSDGAIECESFELEGTTSSETPHTVTFKDVTTTNCTAFGFSATVEMEGCHYEYTTPTTVSTPHEIRSTTHHRCPASAAITVVAAGGLCTVEIGEQSAGGYVALENTESEGVDAVNSSFAIEEVEYVGSGLCGSGSNATISGEAVMHAESEEEYVDFWIE